MGGCGCPPDFVATAQYSGPIRTAVGSGKSPLITGLAYCGGSSGGIEELAASAPVVASSATSSASRIVRDNSTGNPVHRAESRTCNKGPGPRVALRGAERPEERCVAVEALVAE